METIYLKLPSLFADRKPTFHIKITENHALDITDDAINITSFDEPSEYHKYIADSTLSSGCLCYVESTKAEFDEAFIKLVGEINEISKK